MKLSLGLSQRMALEQRLSPQMVMQMTLLGLPLLDFNAELEAEASENPALEVQKQNNTSERCRKSAKVWFLCGIL